MLLHTRERAELPPPINDKKNDSASNRESRPLFLLHVGMYPSAFVACSSEGRRRFMKNEALCDGRHARAAEKWSNRGTTTTTTTTTTATTTTTNPLRLTEERPRAVLPGSSDLAPKVRRAFLGFSPPPPGVFVPPLLYSLLRRCGCGCRVPRAVPTVPSCRAWLHARRRAAALSALDNPR